MPMPSLAMPSPRVPQLRRLWLPGADHDERPECPLWEDVRAADAARRLLH